MKTSVKSMRFSQRANVKYFILPYQPKSPAIRYFIGTHLIVVVSNEKKMMARFEWET